MRAMRLIKVILFAKDMVRMAAFYGEALGLDLTGGSPAEGLIRFDAGGCALALHAIPEAIAGGIEVGDPPAARTDTPIKLAFQVDDVGAARAALIERGAVMGDLRRFGGLVLCDGLDPEGNVFQITTR